LTSVVPFAGVENDVNQGKLLPPRNEAFASRLCLPSTGGALTAAGACASEREPFLQPASAAPHSTAAESNNAPRLESRMLIFQTPSASPRRAA
jgi:hypothetical protein